ncbi:hypothetical protein BDD12DRAFT_878997 [Trichophaea hybrida]|nr:hypothetical protein BDD12DRAFT_878997 [Trichophaea hybrida]
MPAIDVAHDLIKRSKKTGNFAQREPGVILVFCIIGTIVILLTALAIHKRKEKEKEEEEEEEKEECIILRWGMRYDISCDIHEL